MTTLGAQDRDLHYPDGTHVTTARTANGRDVANHERRLRAHREAHHADRLREQDRRELLSALVADHGWSEHDVVTHEGTTYDELEELHDRLHAEGRDR